MIDYLVTILSPEGKELEFKIFFGSFCSVLKVLRAIYIGFKNPRCIKSSSLILDKAKLAIYFGDLTFLLTEDIIKKIMKSIYP